MILRAIWCLKSIQPTWNEKTRKNTKEWGIVKTNSRMCSTQKTNSKPIGICSSRLFCWYRVWSLHGESLSASLKNRWAGSWSTWSSTLCSESTSSSFSTLLTMMMNSKSLMITRLSRAATSKGGCYLTSSPSFLSICCSSPTTIKNWPDSQESVECTRSSKWPDY